MRAIQVLFTISIALGPLATIAELLPPSEMRPIQPAEEQANFDIHRFPDEYEIHLEPGYTIDAHFKTIGKDLSHFIKRRWDYGYLDAEYALFAIHLECVEDVNLVRRDPGVTFIGESAGYSQQNIWDDDHLLPFSEMVPIQPANRDSPTEIATPHHEYEIHLEPGYTIAQHFRTIGKDFTHLIKRRWDTSEYASDPYMFIIRLEAQADLDLVRRDPRVRSVVESESNHFIDPWSQAMDPSTAKSDIHEEL